MCRPVFDGGSPPLAAATARRGPPAGGATLLNQADERARARRAVGDGEFACGVLPQGVQLPTSFAGDQRSVDAYLTLPATGAPPFPAIIVIHEIWGLDEHIRDVADRFAAEGFAAFAPDLYSGELRAVMRPEAIMAAMSRLRSAPPEVQRDPSRLEGELSVDERPGVAALMRVMSPGQRESFARDLVAAVEFLRRDPRLDRDRVSSLGFCMGGGLSARLATLAPQLWRCVIFYGESPPLDDVAKINAAVLGLYGGDDPRVTDGVPAFRQAMEEARKRFQSHVYPGAPHAFFNDRRATYREDPARDAWTRVLDFLRAG